RNHQAPLLLRLVGGNGRNLLVAVAPASITTPLVLCGVKILDLKGSLDGVLLAVEEGTRANAGPAGQHPRPTVSHIVAQWGNQSGARNHDAMSSIIHKESPETFCSGWCVY